MGGRAARGRVEELGARLQVGQVAGRRAGGPAWCPPTRLGSHCPAAAVPSNAVPTAFKRYRAPTTRHGRMVVRHQAIAHDGCVRCSAPTHRPHGQRRPPARTTRTTRPEACTTRTLPAPLRPPAHRENQGPLGPKWCNGALSGAVAGGSRSAEQETAQNTDRSAFPRLLPPRRAGPAAMQVGGKIVRRITNAHNHYGVTSVCPHC